MHYGQKSKNTEENSAPGGVASIGSMHAVRITLGKLRENSSLRTVA